MKKTLFEFMRRGFGACGLGPVVLAVLYWILHCCTGIQTLTVNQVCIGIVSLSALAFIAGGMNVIYQIEQLPLMSAISIHGCVLYVSYLATYLINGWLAGGVVPILAFTCIFVLGFFIIWAVIYLIIKNRTDKLNELLKYKQQDPDI